MVNMVIRKRRHCVVTVVIVRLKPHIDALLLSNVFCGRDEIFWKKLSLFVEVVTSTLRLLVSS